MIVLLRIALNLVPTLLIVLVTSNSVPTPSTDDSGGFTFGASSSAKCNQKATCVPNIKLIQIQQNHYTSLLLLNTFAALDAPRNECARKRDEVQSTSAPV